MKNPHKKIYLRISPITSKNAKAFCKVIHLFPLAEFRPKISKMSIFMTNKVEKRLMIASTAQKMLNSKLDNKFLLYPQD